MWASRTFSFPKAQRYRFAIAGAFGLVHGFGFSYILRDIGLPEEGRAWCLLSFNLGVEIAKISYAHWRFH